jgi:hypothetical protein
MSCGIPRRTQGVIGTLLFGSALRRLFVGVNLYALSVMALLAADPLWAG